MPEPATADQRRLLVLCAIRTPLGSPDWQLLARQAQLDRGLDLLYSGELLETSPASEQTRPILQNALRNLTEAEERVESELQAAAEVGARLTTVLDHDYPANLRLVSDLPPFLFFSGELLPTDARSVAVVGTRNASEAGLQQAREMAEALASHGVTVVSGLARGIDTAAHTATLDAGGRTLAVIGTGITRCYPRENAELSARIAEAGAVVSQFWPTMAPTQYTFPRRNHAMSGISQGTIVIEASGSSGAKMQARVALEHNKYVFLVRNLVTAQEWAAGYLRRGAIEVSDIADVVRHLASAERIQQAGDHRAQLALDLL